MTDNRYIDINEVDPQYNVYRYEKFKLDIEEKKINKICMTEIVNADLMIATFGEDLYASGCRDVLTQGRDVYREMGLSDCLIHYTHNYKNFIVAGTEDISDDQFEAIMYQTYQQFLHSSSESTELSALSRFVVVFGKEDMVNRAKSAFYLNKRSQNNYIIASNERAVLSQETASNVGIFNTINYAIEHNTVVPFYQGLYSNTNDKIEKYEALMRISDADGKIYSPGMFLDIAKRFKQYHTLSKMLIDRALNDFLGKKSELSINLSLFDVENDEFSEWFFDRLRKYPNPSQITIEFIETENYNSGEKLYSFLNEIRAIGCKIAVDDFGVGFATYTSIISLKPDIIKIDGQIVKNLYESVDSKIILNSICYMADLIGAETVAEFVETADIQQILVSAKVDYSQGYHFARPTPIEELDIL